MINILDPLHLNVICGRDFVRMACAQLTFKIVFDARACVFLLDYWLLMVSSICFSYFTNVVQLLCSLKSWLYLNCTSVGKGFNGAHLTLTLLFTLLYNLNLNNHSTLQSGIDGHTKMTCSLSKMSHVRISLKSENFLFQASLSLQLFHIAYITAMIVHDVRFGFERVLDTLQLCVHTKEQIT